MKFKHDSKYMEVVSRICGALLTPMRDPNVGALDPMMLACDISAKIIMAYPREQRTMVLDIFMKRLGAVLEEMDKAEVN